MLGNLYMARSATMTDFNLLDIKLSKRHGKIWLPVNTLWKERNQRIIENRERPATVLLKKRIFCKLLVWCREK